MKKKQRRSAIIQTILLSIFAVLFFSPLYVSLVNAFKDSDMVMRSPLTIQIPPVLEHVQSVIDNPYAKVSSMYWNTILLAGCSIVVTVLVSSLAAYYLARNDSRFSRFMGNFFMIGLMVPYVIVYIPLATTMRTLHIPFGIPSLILIFVSGNISFTTFLYTNFIRSLPRELEEAAALDGATPFRTFWSVLFPLLKPCTATACIFTGLGVWNDFMTPMTLGQVKTITVGVYTAVGPYSANWGLVFAYVLFAAIPVIIAYLMMQKQFINGLTVGASKG